MTDLVRRRTMQAVKSKDTSPEMTVRRITHAMGYRCRLHRKGLPGKPDLVFPSRRKITFVNGCFWHGHECRRGARTPKENRDYWLIKIARNKTRDALTRATLLEAGWGVLTIWECEIREPSVIQKIISGFLR
ncbi:MAG: DNA mismatch endonuclease Vsr [Alphaproteobacteria bacterium]|nr:DNA mismatch endonuclease Vsr [Alphaproteobacteria bacterium]